MERLVKPTVEHLGFELWGVERLGVGRRGKVRVYIETERGITFDDCETVSKQLMTLLDVENVLADNQSLEVSSPGLDRKLFRHDQYRLYVGEEIEVQLHFAVGGSRKLKGILSECNDDEFVIGEHRIQFDKVRSTRLVPHFD